VILADTSVWVDHFRRGNARLRTLLGDSRILCHPFVIGELAVGHLRRRAVLLTLLADLPQTSPAAHEEVLAFVEAHALAGSGLGWIDVHLLCAAALERAQLWTLDRRLAGAAARLGLDA
jgi:predicted nucleic acid-binding protein